MNKIEYYSLSYQGRRESNEDTCLAFKPNDNSLFLAIADGMGGSVGGKIASEIVIDSANKVILERFKDKVEYVELKDILKTIFHVSQKKIAEKIRNDEKLLGMGTTLVCALILDDKFVWGNVGDSRIYLFKNSNLKQISLDHTHLEEYKEKNDVAVSDDILKTYGHYLTRSLDGGKDEADIFPDSEPYEKLEEGNALILCSDGLIINKTSRNEDFLINYLVGTKNLKEAAQNLVSFSYDQGSNDNITVVLAIKGKLKRVKTRIKKYRYPPTFLPKNKTIENLLRTFLYILIPALILSIFFIYTEFFGNRINVGNLGAQEQIEYTFEAKIDSIQTITPNKLKLYLGDPFTDDSTKKSISFSNNKSGLINLTSVEFDSIEVKVPINGFLIGYYDSDEYDQSIKGPYYFFNYNGGDYLLTKENLKFLFSPISNSTEAIAYAELLLRIRGYNESYWSVVWNDNYRIDDLSSDSANQDTKSKTKKIIPFSTVNKSDNIYSVNLITRDNYYKDKFYSRTVVISEKGDLLQPIGEANTLEFENSIESELLLKND